MGSFFDSFDTYDNGTLNGQGSWVADSAWIVRDNIEIFSHAYDQTTVTAKHDISFDNNILRISPLMTIQYNSSGYLYGLMRNSSDEIIGGYMQYIKQNYSSKFYLYIASGFSNYVSGSHSPPYGIEVTLDKKLGEYTSVKIDGVERIDDYTNVTLPNVNRDLDNICIKSYPIPVDKTQGCICHQIGLEGWESWGIPKYLKFPRWQKTRYGMRPWY